MLTAYAAAPPAASSHQGKLEPDLPAPLAALGVGVGVDVPKIITRAVSTRLGVTETIPKAVTGVCVNVGCRVVGVAVAVGKTKPPLPPCPLPEDGGCTGVFVGAGGMGVSVGTGVSLGVTPGGSVALGVLVRVGEGVSDGVTPGASVSVAVGVSVAVSVGVNMSVEAGVCVAVGEGVKVAVGSGVNVFVATGGGGET